MYECDHCGSIIEEDEATIMESIRPDREDGVVCSEMSCITGYMKATAWWNQEEED